MRGCRTVYSTVLSTQAMYCRYVGIQGGQIRLGMLDEVLALCMLLGRGKLLGASNW